MGLSAYAPAALAGGLYFSERGVRPLGRGGAFTAGADDLGAIWHNPAGIYDAGSSLLLDASLMLYETDYQREALVEQSNPNSKEPVARYLRTYPQVTGTSALLPLPTLAGSYKVHRRVVLAAGALAPYGAITSFPEKIDGEPAPQRYSLITLDGSALVLAGLWGAFAPTDEWRFGLGVDALLGKFVATTMFGACLPDRFFCAPEQPDWDALVQLSAGPLFAPSGNAGVQWIPHERWRLGASFHLPLWVRAPATFTARLPVAPVFETAYQEGEDAHVAFELPWRLGLGVQWRPLDALRVELAGQYEGWSIHDAIRITPENAKLRGLVGLPDPYPLSPQSIPRGFQDSVAVRLGGEHDLELWSQKWQVRAGASFESSAVPPEYLSALTVDVPKLTLGLGLGWTRGGLRLDAVYAHIFGFDVAVDPQEAQIPMLNPVQANQPPAGHYVNGGDYGAHADVVGLGVSYQFAGPEA
ncbi:MAG: outer membrane protein transport protein [Deltaproteobacteria bacterium]|nr:outer membrane protein transport protein [Deltaproteobacteria bacterium]